jgi:iron complex transport system substrate-binding protein
LRLLRPLSLAVAATVVVTLAACSTGPGTSTQNVDVPRAAADAFPVTIEHAFGETTITEQPVRVATVAWANQEVPLALGIVPVGMAAVTWGDDDGDGVLPWVAEKLDELGAEAPVLFNETDGIDFEAVNDVAPDVILAAYSGLTQEEYERLSKIAPVVAFPDVAWGTSFEQMIELNAAALGFPDEGDTLIDDLHAEVAAAMADHPGLEGQSVLFSYLDPSDMSQVGFYTSLDPRAGFLLDSGFSEPSVVTEESAGSDSFLASVSSEQADRFADVDVIVTYGTDPEATIAAFQADPLLAQIPAIAAGRVAVLENGTPLSAAATPSPLAISWSISDYIALLAAAAQAG